MSNIVKFQEQKQELDHLKTLAAIASKSGNYAGMSEVTLLNLMLSAKDLGVSPMKALNGGFYVVNGKVCMSTSLMADRIRRAGHSVRIPEWTTEKCVLIGKRKDNDDSVKVEFSMEDAKLAGLSVSPTWKKYPKHMLYNRAMSTLARVLFSDVVGNAYSEEERFDIQNVAPENRPVEEVEGDVVVDIPAVSVSYISEDEVEEVKNLLARCPEIEQKLLKWLEVDSVAKIVSAQLEKTLKAINSHLSKEGAA